MDIAQKPEAPVLLSQWYDAVNPLVSIVVLNWNKAHLTIECLKSLYHHTHGERYEIIVVDNGSRADEFAALSAFDGVHTVLRLDVNRFFGEGNNLGAELAKGKFVMFMNNDVTVTPNWLFPLIQTFRTQPDCGVAGPKFVYPHGMLQEAGALLDEDGDAVQIGKFQDPALPRFNRSRVVDYVSAACVVLRKEHFDQVLGFDFIYEPAYYEDVDLCMKIGELGLKTYYVPDACVVHHENATTADPGNGLNLRGLVDINRGKFVRRWNGFLKSARHGHARLSVRKSTKVPMGRPTAAVFTANRIDTGEPTRHVFSILDALDALGYTPWLLTLERVSSVRIEQIASLTGIALPTIELGTVKERNATASYDVFIAMEYHAAERIDPLGSANYYWTASDPEDAAGYQGVVLNSGKSEIADTVVIKPAVPQLTGIESKSRKIILSEGRFISGDGSNRQDMLIRALRQLIESGVAAELHLVGSLLPESIHRDFFLSCEKLAEGLPVRFHIDAPPDERASLYGEAFIYWHAAQPCKDTGMSETLGLSALRAMSGGAIPIVASDTSPVFAVADPFRFADEHELAQLTQRFIDEPEAALCSTRLDAQAAAREFSANTFMTELGSFLNERKQKAESCVTSRNVG